jgi:hypothetical protein
MGFYLRKSIKAGPFRFNLSKSGIGVSTGIKGLRVGTGPRGNYIHMGRGGFYYRKTLNNAAPSSPASSSSANSLSPRQQTPTDTGYGAFTEIDSGDLASMTDSSSAELLAEFDSKRKKLPLTPFIIIGLLLVLWLLPTRTPDWGYFLAFALGGIGAYVTYNYDQVRKSVVLFYELEGQYETAYQSLHEAFSKLMTVNKAWHVEAQADVYDRKRNAGASQVIKRKGIELSTADAPYVKTNISVPSINAGKQTLFFFPDRLLVFEKNKVGAVSYADLAVEISPSQFIEMSGVPRDAEIVGRTWKYVNKKGGPDKRFSNNQEIPICLYDDMHFKIVTGLNELVQLSKRGLAEGFKGELQGLSRIVHPHQAVRETV